MDVVEVSPPYDHAEVTAMAAHRAVLEAISALAVRKRDGHEVRHETRRPAEMPAFRVEEEVIEGELARGSATSGAVLRGEGTPRGGG
jgi:hypothetical protein